MGRFKFEDLVSGSMMEESKVFLGLMLSNLRNIYALLGEGDVVVVLDRIRVDFGVDC